MEYCEGGDMSQMLQKCKQEQDFIAEDVIWKIFTQIALALNECHHRKSGKILHRDLKPANIFLDAQNNIKLGDFGLSRVISDQSAFAKTHVGTPYYMSPEQINESKYNEKSDIWSAGCLLYEMAALKPPFEATNHLALAWKIKDAQFDRLPYRYSEDIQKLIQSMVNLDPEKRPSVVEIMQIPQIKLRIQQRRIRKKHSQIQAREEEIKQKQELMIEKQKLLQSREAEIQKQRDELAQKHAELISLESEHFDVTKSYNRDVVNYDLLNLNNSETDYSSITESNNNYNTQPANRNFKINNYLTSTSNHSNNSNTSTDYNSCGTLKNVQNSGKSQSDTNCKKETLYTLTGSSDSGDSSPALNSRILQNYQSLDDVSQIQSSSRIKETYNQNIQNQENVNTLNRETSPSALYNFEHFKNERQLNIRQSTQNKLSAQIISNIPQNGQLVLGDNYQDAKSLLNLNVQRGTPVGSQSSTSLGANQREVLQEQSTNRDEKDFFRDKLIAREQSLDEISSYKIFNENSKKQIKKTQDLVYNNNSGSSNSSNSNPYNFNNFITNNISNVYAYLGGNNIPPRVGIKNL